MNAVADRRGEAGFSLVETLVALAILAGMTVTLAGIARDDARQESAMRERRLAALVARSVLDQAAAGATSDAGEEAGLAWRIARQPYGSADPFDRLPIEQLAVTVSGGNGRPLLTLTTLRARR